MEKKCLSCEIVSGRKAVPGGPIHETSAFHAHQDVAYPVPGLVIVAAKRHFRLLTDMTSDETAEFVPLVQQIRMQQQKRLGIEHVYYFYNEDTKHHFNFWMVPRYEWMVRFGKSVEAVRPALLHARETMSSATDMEAVTRAAELLRQGMQSD